MANKYPNQIEDRPPVEHMQPGEVGPALARRIADEQKQSSQNEKAHDAGLAKIEAQHMRAFQNRRKQK